MSTQHATIPERVSVCGFDDIFTAGPDLDQATIDYLTRYLNAFAKPIPGQNGELCLKCENPLMGLLGTFRWGIAHGEGHCVSCRWPIRLYHLLTLPGVGKEQRLVFPLCYHPSLVDEAVSL